MEYYLKSKNPLKSQNEIKKMLFQKKNGLLTEEEWKGIIYYIYKEEDSKILEKKIITYIQKQKEKLKTNDTILMSTYSEFIPTYNLGNSNLNNGSSSAEMGRVGSAAYLCTHGSKKMTRREMFNLFKYKEDDSILYKHFIKIVGEYQIKNRVKYLKNFVKLFRKFDTDFDGVLNENEFINLIKDIPYCQNNLDEYIFKFLSSVDPFNNKKINFSECVALFGMEMINDNKIENNSIDINKDRDKIYNENNDNNDINKNNENVNQVSLLDKICLENVN